MDMKEVQSTIKYIESIWSEYYPEHIFEYVFFDEFLEELYSTESKLLTMIQSASFLAILIGCLGLIGLASFMVLQRTKEIGIRKILGASVRSLYYLISKEFVKWVVLANIIAWPIAYILTKIWLQEFAYRIQLEAGFFLLGGLISFGIAVLVVSVQVIRATTDNPVDSLQYE
jgi:putative ABC transport system permease protein